jgi:hypothetical protein
MKYYDEHQPETNAGMYMWGKLWEETL